MTAAPLDISWPDIAARAEHHRLKDILRAQLFGDDAPARIGRFEVRRQLGSGGMGRKELIGQAFAASGAPYAGVVWASVRADVDAYAAAWSAARERACRATMIDHTQSQELFDLQMACLHDDGVSAGILHIPLSSGGRGNRRGSSTASSEPLRSPNRVAVSSPSRSAASSQTRWTFSATRSFASTTSGLCLVA